MATLIRVDGTREDVAPDNGKDFKRDQLYRLIDTDMVEIVRLDRSHILVIDEEGKCKCKAINHEATRLASRVLHPLDVIVGDAVLCYSREVR